MTKIRLTRQFNFEMAHALWNYDKSCRNVHGHSYALYVTIIGEPRNDERDPKNGMVVDFADIRNWIKSEIVEEFDHSLMISADADIENLKNVKQMFEKLNIVTFQPTCENLLNHIAERVKKNLPPDISLHSIKLQETPTSYAEWYAEDQH